LGILQRNVRLKKFCYGENSADDKLSAQA